MKNNVVNIAISLIITLRYQSNQIRPYFKVFLFFYFLVFFIGCFTMKKPII